MEKNIIARYTKNEMSKRQYIGVRPDRYNKGKWEYRIHRQGQKEIQEGGFNSQLAAAKAREKRIKELALVNKPTEEMLQVKDWTMKWYKNYSKRYKRSHKDDYNKIIKIVNPAIGEKFLDRVELEDGHAVLDKVKDRNPNVSDSTLDRYISLLKKIFNAAVEGKKIRYSPFIYLRKFDPDNRRDRVYSDAEVAMIFKAAQQSYKQFMFFLLNVGTRPTATGLIKWEEINFEDNSVKMDYLNAKGKRTEHSYFDPEIKTMLLKIKMLGLHNEYVFVYKGKDGMYKPIDKYTWRREWDRIKKATGIKGWFYDLKRTFATRCNEIGIPIEDIKELLHHKEVTTTMRYIGKKEGRKKNAISKLFAYQNRKIPENKNVSCGYLLNS